MHEIVMVSQHRTWHSREACENLTLHEGDAMMSSSRGLDDMEFGVDRVSCDMEYGIDRVWPLHTIPKIAHREQLKPFCIHTTPHYRQPSGGFFSSLTIKPSVALP
eukprot:3708700-Rhodomonas_salina.2